MDRNTSDQDLNLGINDNSLMNEKQESYKLTDYSEKDKSWDNNKNQADKVTEIFKKYSIHPMDRLGKWCVRVGMCSDWLGFNPLCDEKTGELKLKLSSMSSCHVRGCPVCGWRRSLKNKEILKKNLPLVENKLKSKWVFLTLTVENCDIENLKETIKAMNAGFIKLKRRKDWQALGWIKFIEVTNKQGNSSSHPHFHILLQMPLSYFNRNYLTQKQWIQNWRKSMKLDYDPNIDIRIVKRNPKKGLTEIESIVAEIAKYATKPQEVILNPEWFVEYVQQVHKMRFVDSGGTLKGILKDNYTDEELINIGDEENEEEDKEKLWFFWNRPKKHYYHKDKFS